MNWPMFAVQTFSMGAFARRVSCRKMGAYWMNNQSNKQPNKQSQGEEPSSACPLLLPVVANCFVT
jgi:hypothetical protein